MSLGPILLAIALVLANGFFVATEFAMVKIRPTRIRALLDEGKPGAENVLKLLQRMDVTLSATQFGITLASPPSMTATTELVVPRSMPMIFSSAIAVLLLPW